MLYVTVSKTLTFDCFCFLKVIKLCNICTSHAKPHDSKLLGLCCPQEEVEWREQVDKVSVHQPMLEGKHQDLEEDVDIANTIIGTDLDQTHRGSSDSFESPGVELEEMLYRNGLVFDVKPEED